MWGDTMTSLAYQYDHEPSPKEQVELYEIAHLMKTRNLSDQFVSAAIRTALSYEGVADLLKLWRDEPSQAEQSEIIADIQDLIDDCEQRSVEQFTQIKINDLDAIRGDIRAFKDSLLEVVNQKSNISQLAKKTGIPQPSLSRFFNSNTMPRRSTLLKIAAALDLDAITINSAWSR